MAVWTTERFIQMFGCFRKGEAVDPKAFTVAAVGILMKYPKAVVEKITDPIDGLPANSVFLPSLAEIKLACEKEYRFIAEAEARRLRVEQQFKDRAEWENQSPSDRLQQMGKAWLDRADPAVQQLSGQKSRVLSEAQKEAALDDAAKVGRELHGMTLLPETLEIIREQDNLNAAVTHSSNGRETKEHYTDDEIPF